jgi:adenylylsulfate kinase-like enzyme
MELDTLLILSQQLGFASQERVTKVRSQIVQVSKLLNGLIRYQSISRVVAQERRRQDGK